MVTSLRAKRRIFDLNRIILSMLNKASNFDHKYDISFSPTQYILTELFWKLHSNNNCKSWKQQNLISAPSCVEIIIELWFEFYLFEVWCEHIFITKWRFDHFNFATRFVQDRNFLHFSPFQLFFQVTQHVPDNTQFRREDTKNTKRHKTTV